MIRGHFLLHSLGTCSWNLTMLLRKVTEIKLLKMPLSFWKVGTTEWFKLRWMCISIAIYSGITFLCCYLLFQLSWLPTCHVRRLQINHIHTFPTKFFKSVWKACREMLNSDHNLWEKNNSVPNFNISIEGLKKQI